MIMIGAPVVGSLPPPPGEDEPRVGPGVTLSDGLGEADVSSVLGLGLATNTLTCMDPGLGAGADADAVPGNMTAPAVATVAAPQARARRIRRTRLRERPDSRHRSMVLMV